MAFDSAGSRIREDFLKLPGYTSNPNLNLSFQNDKNPFLNPSNHNWNSLNLAPSFCRNLKFLILYTFT